MRLHMPVKCGEYAAAPIIAMHADALEDRALCHAILAKWEIQLTAGLQEYYPVCLRRTAPGFA